ncbi:Acidic mammalian chitinase-like 12, partial [Homarus americanus]
PGDERYQLSCAGDTAGCRVHVDQHLGINVGADLQEHQWSSTSTVDSLTNNRRHEVVGASLTVGPRLAVTAANDGVMVCYYGSWAVYRPDKGKFDVEAIDPAICTHLIFGFAGLSYDNKIRALHANNMLLTAAVSAGKLTIDPAFDIPGVAQQVDWILMAYDLHGAWDPTPTTSLALYQYPDDTGDNAHSTRHMMVLCIQDFAVNYWIDGGMPSTKIALGVPLYGRCWKLNSNTDEHGYYAPPASQDLQDPTPESRILGYNEICEFQKTESDWVVEIAPGMNEHTYSYSHERIWCSYDDHDSCVVKNVDNGYDATEEICAAGTLYNPQAKFCDWASSVCAIDNICPNDCPKRLPPAPSLYLS